MRVLIDAQLSPRLAAVLRRAGHQAEHVFDLGMFKTPDIDIWHHAARIGAAILTKDSDFAAMRLQAEQGPAVTWLRLGNVPNTVLERALLDALAEIAAAVESGEVLIEVR